jgi:hypothetical protein
LVAATPRRTGTRGIVTRFPEVDGPARRLQPAPDTEVRS